MFKCVIFDLDDTLYRERDYVVCAMQNVAGYFQKKYGLNVEKTSEELMEILDEYGRGKVFDIFLQHHRIQDNVAHILQVYRNTKPTLHLYDDAKKLIAELRRKGIILGVITDGCSKVQHHKIDALNICQDFDDIIVTDDYESAMKPSTVSYRMILEKYPDISAEDCVYIGDNPKKDFIGARAVGMATMRIIRESGEHMQVRVPQEIEADICIHSLMEVLESVKWRNHI